LLEKRRKGIYFRDGSREKRGKKELTGYKSSLSEK